MPLFICIRLYSSFKICLIIYHPHSSSPILTHHYVILSEPLKLYFSYLILSLTFLRLSILTFTFLSLSHRLLNLPETFSSSPSPFSTCLILSLTFLKLSHPHLHLSPPLLSSLNLPETFSSSPSPLSASLIVS